MAFGTLLEGRLLGILTLGAGPYNAHSLVDGAKPHDCLTLTRLWLSDELPCNSESRVLGLVLGFLKRHTQVKFLITYADPSAGHVGTIYQATNWLYTGLSEPMPLYDLGDGQERHSRSLDVLRNPRALFSLAACRNSRIPYDTNGHSSADHQLLGSLRTSALPSLTPVAGFNPHSRG